MSGGASAWGIRSLADCFLRYYQPSGTLYLRRQNVQDQSSDYSALGFQPAVSGGLGGFTDTLIDPPADVQEVSLHNIGILGGHLHFGARIFIISHTFVLNQIQLYNYTDPYLVWRDTPVVGLYYNQRLFSMDSITHEEVGGHTTLWKIVGNSHEYPTAPST
jgi:hypothetical protein